MLRDKSDKKLYRNTKSQYRAIGILICTAAAEPARKKFSNQKMLRRKPTALTITNEDIIAFEEARLQRLEIASANANANSLGRSTGSNLKQGERNTHENRASLSSNNAQIDPNDELKPLPGDKAKIVRTRDERIGARRL